MLNLDAIRAQFPALQQIVNGNPLVYLDSAATTQKPQCVIDAISHYYSQHNANVHRGSHSLTAQATSQFEARVNKSHNLLVRQAAKILSGRAVLPKHSTSLHKVMPAAHYKLGMRFWSVKLNTTPISCRGKWSLSKRARKWSKSR